MRKEDITVTDKNHSVIYAIGTATESNSNVWVDLDSWPNRRYTPGYVLEVRDNGFVIVLVANAHPDSQQGKRAKSEYNEQTRAYDYTPQASALDALGYTLQDAFDRTTLMAKYSHWPLSPEQTVERDAAVAASKPLPLGWSVRTMRATYVRMLWAEYATRLDAAIRERKLKADADERQQQEACAEQESVMDRIVAANIGVATSEKEYQVNRSGSGQISVPIATALALIDAYEQRVLK